jgi:hypothetical protein
MAKWKLTLEQRFWAKVAPPDENGCRRWLGPFGRSRYGRAWNGERKVPAHSLAWRLTYQGPTRPDPSTFGGGPAHRHSCDHTWCAEPTHVYPGTHQENEDDKSAKGRRPVGARHWTRTAPERLARGNRAGLRLHPERAPRGDRHGSRSHPERVARGERNGMSKLTEDDVRAILLSDEDNAATGRRFGVTRALVRGIRLRKSWRHVSIP